MKKFDIIAGIIIFLIGLYCLYVNNSSAGGHLVFGTFLITKGLYNDE